MSKQWNNTKDCQMFYSGDTMDYEDKIQFQVRGQKKRALVRFNKVMKYVDSVLGFMQQNRRHIKYIARSENSQKQVAYSKYANAVAGYIRDNTGADHLESEQDLDMLVCGYGAVETDISYVQGNTTTCPNGEIIKARIDPLTVFWDHSSKRMNVKDARWIGYWSDYNLQDAINLFTGSEAEDFEDRSYVEDDETDYVYNPYGGKYNKIALHDSVDWVDQKEEKVRVYNFQWYEIESYWRADNPVLAMNTDEAKILAYEQMQMLVDENDSGDMFGFDPKADILVFDLATKNKLKSIFGKRIEPVEFKRRVYYTAVISGKHIFTWFKSVSQTGFSIQMKTGTYNATGRMWIGMVNNMMQPQMYYNKSLTELLFTISANSKGGVLYEKDSVEDVQQFEEKYASTTAMVEVANGALSGGRIQPKGQNIPVTGLDGIIAISDNSIADASGVDKAFLGGGMETMQSGILYRRRIKQVLSSIAKYFDAISDYQKTMARIDLDFIRIWAENNYGLEFEVGEDDGTYTTQRVAPDKFVAEYGIALHEAMETDEDRQEKAEIISAIGDKLSTLDPNAAKTIYGISLKYLNLDSEDKQKIAETLQTKEQPIDPAYVKQLEDNLRILTSETNQADIKRKLAGAEKDMASIEKIKAETVKTLEEAQQKDIETNLMMNNPVTSNTI